MDLINGTSYGRGVEQTIYDIGLEDPIGLACMQKRFQCCYEISKKGLETANGQIDILWIGDDYGTQNGLLMSPEKWRKLFFGKLKEMCALGHEYGAKVMLHCCGSTRPLWPDLIEAGVDIYQTVQPEAKDMDPAELHHKYSKDAALRHAAGRSGRSPQSHRNSRQKRRPNHRSRSQLPARHTRRKPLGSLRDGERRLS
jgi:hypothetical protein